MAKFKFFWPFFLLFYIFSSQLNILLARPVLAGTLQDQCNLPAPDSFRITQVGGDFISLAWNPIFPGANHQLVVLESDGMGGWVTILIENQVSGDTYRADNLEPGISYRFVVATKCANGDPSEIKAIIDGITLIVDLMLDGRKPVHAVLAGDCNYLSTSYDWVGFKISTFEGDQFLENYFEVKLKGGEVSNANFLKNFEIRRHYLNNPIVAVDEDGAWPNCLVPIREDVPTTFRLQKLIGGGPNFEIIGHVKVSQNLFPNSLNFCPVLDDLGKPWNPKYILTPLVANKATEPEKCWDFSVVDDRSVLDTSKNNSEFKYTITDNFISIQIDQLGTGLHKCKVFVFNTSGQLISEKSGCINETLYISTDNFPSGVYILKVSLNGKNDVLKFIKIN